MLWSPINQCISKIAIVVQLWTTFGYMTQWCGLGAGFNFLVVVAAVQLSLEVKMSLRSTPPTHILHVNELGEDLDSGSKHENKHR